jgi:virginiamycin B lyase
VKSRATVTPIIAAAALLTVAPIGCRHAPSNSTPEEKPQPVAPGVPAVQVPFATLKPAATWKIGGTADWVVITPDAVWVAGSKPDSIQRIDPKTNKVVASVPLTAEACSGLEYAFGSIWVPVCTTPPTTIRIDAKTNQISATLNIGPAAPEGGIAASADSIWLVTDKAGTLSRIDPKTNAVSQRIQIAAGSFNPIFDEGTIWISGLETSVLTAVDAASGEVRDTIAVGPKPRFLVADAGSIWTLNQGNGSISRVDLRMRKLAATIAAGLSGEGGDICYGGGALWATLFGLPLTRIDPANNQVIRQWKGPGGDSMRFGHNALWLTDYHAGTLGRYPLDELLKP